MARVTLTIGGISHDVACRDGGEARLKRAGAMVDGHWSNVRAAAGGSASRAMLLAALMMADELIEEREAPASPDPHDDALVRLAERLESLADTLEADAPSA